MANALVQESAAVGRRRNSVTTRIEALGTVYAQFQGVEGRRLKRRLGETTLEMERARMSAEDARSAMVSPYGTNHHTEDPRRRRLSWREFGTDRNEMCLHLVYDVMEPAQQILEEARKNIHVVLQGPASSREAALTAAYNAMCDAEKCLRDDSDSESNGGTSHADGDADSEEAMVPSSSDQPAQTSDAELEDGTHTQELGATARD